MSVETLSSVPTDHNDPVNTKILEVSEDLVSGFQRNPFQHIADKSGIDLETVVSRIRAMVEAGVIRRVRQTLLATKLAQMPTKAIALTKEALNRSQNTSLDSQLDHENELQSLAGRSHDYNEGVKAFLEKRKPVYRGE